MNFPLNDKLITSLLVNYFITFLVIPLISKPEQVCQLVGN